jgi:pantoate--beta-alanine ligase
MKTVRSVADIRAHVAAARAAGRSVGLVPTMGAFHGGHHALIRAARERCDEVVVWLFVNPTQFNEASDLAAYPRDEARDATEAAALGVDVLYAPAVA